MVRKVLGVVMILVGVVWILQGVNVLKGSFMTGHIVWAIIGAVLLVFGVGVFRAKGADE